MSGLTMTRLTYEALRQERIRIYNERMDLLARAHHLMQEAESLLKIETDLMRMQDNMQIQARFQQGTEARQ